MKVLCNLGFQRMNGVRVNAYRVEVVDAKGTHRTVLPLQYVEPEALAEFEERIRLTSLAHSKQKGKTNVGDPMPHGSSNAK